MYIRTVCTKQRTDYSRWCNTGSSSIWHGWYISYRIVFSLHLFLMKLQVGFVYHRQSLPRLQERACGFGFEDSSHKIYSKWILSCNISVFYTIFHTHKALGSSKDSLLPEKNPYIFIYVILF